MRELLRIVEDPRSCSYLTRETASLEYRIVADLEPAEYADLLARGYRRFGHHLFRPACADCRRCVSLRVLVQDFSPSRSQERACHRNRDIRVEIGPAFMTHQHLELYNAYHRYMSHEKGWAPQTATPQSYGESFVLGGSGIGLQFMFFRGRILVGVALADRVPDAISMVYFFHHPDWRQDSPGVFSILSQIHHARDTGLRYAYLGYWIAANPSMAYKNRYRPHQILESYPGDDEEPSWCPEGAEA